MLSTTSRTTLGRKKHRAVTDRSALHAVLDEGLICHLGIVHGGTPYSIPTMYARRGDAIYIHGAPASRMLKTAGENEVCLTVSLLDGLVMARSAFKHSMNYRSVMVIGKAAEVTDPDEKMVAFEALVEHVCRGRWAEIRQPSRKELRATRVLRLPLGEASAKIRTGGPIDDEADLELPAWAGVIPLRVTPQPVIPASERPVPDYASRYRRPGWDG